jgi:ABC-2 type transport system permease protein
MLIVLVQRLPHLAGWDFPELLFIYAFARSGIALAAIFLDSPYTVDGTIHTGALDILLLRPVGSLFQVIGRAQQPNNISTSLTSLGLLGYSIAHMTIVWGPGRFFWLMVMTLAAMVIRFGMLMLVATVCFRTKFHAVLLLVGQATGYMVYPMEIFAPPLRAFLTFVVPLALTSYYPAAFILRPGSFAWVPWVCISAAIGFTVACRAAWRWGLRHYESSGGLAAVWDG